MTNNQQETAEQLVHDHLEQYEVVQRLSETRIYQLNKLYIDFPVIAESYLALIDELKIAKEALDFYVRDSENAVVAKVALSKLSI